MLQMWVLDVVIRDGILIDEITQIASGLWLIVSADGIPRPFSTNQCEHSKNPLWNFPARLILQFVNVSKSYLYVTLCSKGRDGKSTECLARSKIGLRSLSIGSPKTFNFPLMNTKNSAQIVMNIRITATLSSVTQNSKEK